MNFDNSMKFIEQTRKDAERIFKDNKILNFEIDEYCTPSITIKSKDDTYFIDGGKDIAIAIKEMEKIAQFCKATGITN